MLIVVGHLNTEDISRYRQKRARYEAVELNPGAFSADETYKIVFDLRKIEGELSEQYNLPVMSEIDPATGICTIEGEFISESGE